MTTPFHLKLTADFYEPTGEPRFEDLGLNVLAGHDHIHVGRFEQHTPVISPAQLQDANAAIVLTPQVSAQSLTDSPDLLAIGRFGVGFDTVDVQACTDQDVLVMITAGAVDRSMAEATIGWMIALTHQMLIKDRLVRTGDWEQRTSHNGCELRDRTLGIVGLGGIGRELVSMLKCFDMNPPIAFDPFVPQALVEELGVRTVELPELMRTADFVSIHCPLNDGTRGLIGAEQLALMKSDAYLLNTARGGIIDETALYEALVHRRIAGAALDCFEGEPVTSPSPFRDLDNVIMAPHSIAWTTEFFRDIGQTACQSMLDLSLGRRPHGVLNPELFDRESFRTKWQRVTAVAPQ